MTKYYKKEVNIENGIKVIVYEVNGNKVKMYRDNQVFDVSAKIPPVVFGMEIEYDKISEAEAKELIETQGKV